MRHETAELKRLCNFDVRDTFPSGAASENEKLPNKRETIEEKQLLGYALRRYVGVVYSAYYDSGIDIRNSSAPHVVVVHLARRDFRLIARTLVAT